VHLEFSALAGRVPPQDRWEDWLAATLAAQAALAPAEIEAGLDNGMEALEFTGTILVGEVTNTGASWPRLQAGPLAYHLFYECLGFNLVEAFDLPAPFPFFRPPEVASALWLSAAAHAPYSVSPALFQAVDRWNAPRGGLQMVHLAESRAETDFLAHGNQFLQDLLKERGRWLPDFQPPGVSPAAYLNGLGFLGPRTLTVHGTWLSPRDCRLLAATGTWLILCPRSNSYSGAGRAPVPQLLAAGVKTALGTDSLASNWDLNLFGEMQWLCQNYPDYPKELWLRFGTLNGARALSRHQEYGSITPGKRAALGFVPLAGQGDFWDELYCAGAAGRWRRL
jgi:cytosine/adenosine deaminase-related metal-dependent hydrolase